MSTYPSPGAQPRRGVDPALIREVAGAVVVLIGFTLIVFAGFMWCDPAGVAALGLVLTAVGVYLGVNR